MTSPRKILRGAYVQKLAGLVVNGISIPVYDTFAVDSAPLNYIVLSSYNNSEQRNKCRGDHRPTQQIDIITMYSTQGGSKLADEIAEEVIARISQNDLNLSPSYQLVTTELVMDDSMDGFDESYKVYRRIIRFQHYIQSIL